LNIRNQRREFPHWQGLNLSILTSLGYTVIEAECKAPEFIAGRVKRLSGIFEIIRAHTVRRSFQWQERYAYEYKPRQLTNGFPELVGPSMITRNMIFYANQLG
jgi:hypothetical protein